MKKVLLIMAAALMTLAQCRKQETSPATPSANTIKMTVTAGPGAKTDITDEGRIRWTSGDVLYVSDGANWLGSLTLDGEGGSASGTFTGTIQDIGEGTTPCHFFYLGKGIVTTTPTGTTAASISFASQDGSREGALKYHLGHGSADVTVSGGVATGAVAMRTEIAIAHLKLKMDGADYTGSVTMGGTGVSNTLSVNPDGTFSGDGDGGITIGNGDGESGERYVTLIPTTETGVLNVAFTGDATGSMTFAKGIHENKFYGMSEAIVVTLEVTAPPYISGEFSVSGTKTVEFASGNLYYDGTTDNKWKFEANQWDFRTYNGKGSCIDGTYNKANGTPINDWGLFGWSGSNQTHYGKITTGNNSDYSGTTLNDWGGITDLPLAGEGKTWSTLTKDEWNYLLNTRDKASSLRAWVTLDNKVPGLVILPDGSTTAASTVTTTALVVSSGAVFLPASGYRHGTVVSLVGSYGFYWSSTPYEDYEDGAYNMYFNSGDAFTSSGGYRFDGNAVRLVR